MVKVLAIVLALSAAATPAVATAQGRGGFGGGRGRGQQGQRAQGDSASAGAPRVQLSFVDLVFAHRSELQLTDSQTVKVANIRMVAMSKRAILSHALDSVKSTLVADPAEAVTPPTDSSRKVLMTARRALASALGDLHDVDVNARNQTLFVLSPDQQKRAEQLEETADSASPMSAGSGSGGGDRRRGSGRPGGGMGNP
jgi:hypothetical protein